jgi:hypothetical protein
MSAGLGNFWDWPVILGGIICLQEKKKTAEAEVSAISFKSWSIRSPLVPLVWGRKPFQARKKYQIAYLSITLMS